MARRRFEQTGGPNAHFWEIDQRYRNVVSIQGRLGSDGEITIEEMPSVLLATDLVTKRITEKVQEGYREVSMSVGTQFALNSTFGFAKDVVSRDHGEAYVPRVGDVIEAEAVQGTVTQVTFDGIQVLNEQGKVETVPRSDWIWVKESSYLHSIWDKHQLVDVPDGVAFSDDIVPTALRESLLEHVDDFARSTPVDYHPGSGTRVRDLVHPSLYPYVQGKSQWRGVPVPTAPAPSHDRWGRHYESSRMQWLPSPVLITADGQAEFRSDIHNISPENKGLYRDLAGLFSAVLPLVESVIGYADNTSFWVDGESGLEGEHEAPELHDVPPVTLAPPRPLRNRELQVITKLVEYKLDPGETHEGVWHVEGMSHEHIVATCVYVLDRDMELRGGTLEFKRAYTEDEAGFVFYNIDQCRPDPISDMVHEGVVPVGSVATPAGRVVVFPNSHIHKLSTLWNQGLLPARRKVVVFWVVDPDVSIVSTRDVFPLQDVLSYEEALAIRLALMEERKRHKESYNVRAVSLCEH